MSTHTPRTKSEGISSGAVADQWFADSADGVNMDPDTAGGVVIAGVGNLLLGDDGVGVHAVREIQHRDLAAGAAVIEIGTAVMGAVYSLEKAAHIILVDAVQAGGSPGSVYLFRADEAAAGADANGRGISMHQLGIVNALHLFAPDAHPRIHVVGVEPASIAYGTKLSPEVETALPKVLEAVTSLTRSLL